MITLDAIKNKLLMDIREELGTDVEADDNLLYSGLSSLAVMRVMSHWRKEGYRIRFSRLIKNPNVSSWAKIISESERTVPGSTGNKKKVSMYEPFDMTDVQYAYWIGRRGDYLGNVGCHGYFEVNAEALDLERLERAWNTLFDYHPMLRAKFTEEGKQVVGREGYPGKFKVTDLAALDKARQRKFLDDIRKQSSHRLMDIAAGEVFTLKVSVLGENRFRLHFDIDLLVCDVHSFRILLRDLANLYEKNEMPPVEKEWDFACYLKDTNEKKKEAAAQAEAYWRAKLDTLPGAPRIYVKEDRLHTGKLHFARHEKMIPEKIVTVIRKNAAKHNSTLAAVMLTAYGYVLSRWSENKSFLMNLPMFNRGIGEGVDNVVADFTNLLLVPLNFEKPRSFAEYLEETGEAFQESIDHSDFSGVKILRELKKKGVAENGIPFVFSCNLGGPLVSETFKEAFGDIDYMISQTPQVLLDFQLFDDNGGLRIVWDAVEEVFPYGMLDEMFDCFVETVEKLGDGSSWEEQTGVSSSSQRERIASVKNFIPESEHAKTMIGGILEMAKRDPQATAVIEPETGKKVSRGELVRRGMGIASALKKNGLKKGDRVVVMAERRWETIASFLAVQLCGAAYIPVRADQPEARLASIIRSSEAKLMLTYDSSRAEGMGIQAVNITEIPNEVEGYEENEASPETVAYVIFTSGSTGTPKGVAISHKAAMNTICEINRMYKVGDGDVSIGVSSFDFDLSVYDVFGLLNAGGAYMIIPASDWRDAAKWAEYAEKYRVTIWNSVPAIAGMYQSELASRNQQNTCLRRIFLSGDWCPLELPELLKETMPDAELTVMGGATEAAIWSNYIDVSLPVPKEWKSVPYGKALKNQMYRVVDRNGEDVPDYCGGELLIGGAGVAEGYVGDCTLTEKKFFTEFGIRWYHTGDMGRIWMDGTIEFLGRMDTQMKIRGHRIEAGEIEAVIKGSPLVKETVVYAVGDSFDKKLVAAILPGRGEARTGLLSIAKEPDFDGTEDEAFYDLCRCLRSGYLEQAVAAVTGTESNLSADTVSRLEKWKAESGAGESTKKTAPGTENVRERIRKFMSPFSENWKDLLEGTKTAADIITSEEFVSPGEMMEATAIGRYSIDRIIDTVRAMDVKLEVQGRDLRILEVGTRSYGLSEKLRDEFPQAVYTILESSKYYLDRAKKVLGNNSHIEFVQGDISGLAVPELGEKTFDIIIFNNTLHQTDHIENALKNAGHLMEEGGRVVFAEITEIFPLADLSIELLGGNYRDLRKETGRMVLSKNEWLKEVERLGYIVEGVLPECGDPKGFVFVVAGSFVSYAKALKDARTRVNNALPAYMHPEKYIGITRMPVSANGKIDRKTLEVISAIRAEDEKVGEKLTATERALSDLWKKILGSGAGKDSNFFQLGGDSLLATKLVIEIRKTFGVNFSIEKIFSYQTLEEMAEYLDENTENPEVSQKERESTFWTEDRKHANDPFPLTDVQQAYWLGRTDLFRNGGMSTQCYFEMNCVDLDIQRAEGVLNRMITAYDTLRTVVLPDGLHQKTLRSVPKYRIAQYDLRSETESEKQRRLQEIREQSSHMQFEPGKWPMFDIRYVACEENRGRLMLDFDNILMDGWSMFYFMKEWKAVYDHPETEVLAPDITFRDYMMTYQKVSASGRHEEDLRYWRERIEEVYPAPELPVKNIEKREKIGFRRLRRSLDENIWEGIKQKLKKESITPAVFLLSVYAEVIARWSLSSRFSINLTTFNRHEFHPGVHRLQGDFTALTIHGIDMDSAETFLKRTAIIQKKMWQDLNHSYVTGVEIERWLTKSGRNGMMPVVYTCGLGLENGTERQYEGYLGEMLDGLSYTPQVWLDNQVSEEEGRLIVSWDYDHELFPGHMAEDMFEAYMELIERLAAVKEMWTVGDRDLVDVRNRELIKDLNTTELALPHEDMLAGFRRSVQLYPDKICIRTEKGSVTYKEADRRTDRIASWLCRNGVAKGDVVAIKAVKGIGQILSTVAILKCGAVYLPLKQDNPFLRNKDIVERSGAKAVIVTDECERRDVTYTRDQITLMIGAEGEMTETEMAAEEAREENTSCAPEDLAYIIYTSGTTGVPKGVAISHGAAMNTIMDVNRRIRADGSDSVLQISDLSFDLSVYDIFGMFAVGGTIVVPAQDMVKEPSAWVKLMDAYGCTIWNSVPMYVQMLIAYLSGRKTREAFSLRTILMSGDWIPLGLYDEIKENLGEPDIYGLGGATECSIWSNIFKIEGIDKDWVSIPYGRPLANQRYYIYDRKLRDVPNLVPGDLYIAGAGLAQCYWRDEERTNESFFVHPVTKERLYRTGDKALYMEDGNICFCGREDSQVKRNGFRIELGEIDICIRNNTSIRNSTSIVEQDRIITFVTSEEKTDTTEIKEKLKEHLPEYMIPSDVIWIDAIPLSSNGKVDRKTLVRILRELEEKAGDRREEKSSRKLTETEEKVSAIWKEILGIAVVSPEDSFISLGGDSLSAVKTASEITSRLQVEITLGDVYEHPTLEGLSSLIDTKLGEEECGEI
uniref:Amino acid adenylation enzyme/thioester reductase family protein n=1 Tax=Eubacterium cellulosolvens (strain ATCC 43171 / JCM 9499 / 6) TaxID=633697 RepID=I5AX01_EUBC6